MATASFARFIVAIAGLALLTGCQTYMQQKADLQAGGPQRRIDAASQRLQVAQDTTYSREVELADNQAYLASLEGDLAAAERNLAAQRSRLAQARAANRISASEEQQLGAQLVRATNQFQDTALDLQVEQAQRDDEAVVAKRAELARLQSEIESINREIAILLQ